MNFQYLIKPFSENVCQQSTVNYLRTVYPSVLFTTGLLGIKLPAWAMWLLAALGYKNGTPDVMIFEPRHGFHGLFIEMKRGRTEYIEAGKRVVMYPGKLSEDQTEVLARLNALGYEAHVCYGFDQAKAVIDAYFK